MTNIYQALKSLIGPELIAKAAETLGEKETDVQSGVSVILPSLLGRMAKDGDNQKVREVINLAGKNKIITKLGDIFEGHGVIDGVNYGERFENALVGSKNTEFPATVAAKAGINHESADRLSNWVSATIAAYVGNKVVVEHQGYPAILAGIEKEKDSLRADIPMNIASMLGLGAFLGAAKPEMKQEPKAAVAGEKKVVAAPKKKSLAWLWWLLALLLILLLFFLWRSCDRKKAHHSRSVAHTEQEMHKQTADVRHSAIPEGMVELVLPDGHKMVVRKGGCEECLFNYLNSEEFKKASEKDLENKWFDFDDIDFKHASSTELTEGSFTQLINIAAILKAYPNVKIKVGGYADKTGTQAVNQDISEARAKYIKSVFEEKGVEAARVSTVGFGERYATKPVNASDEERAADRHIALRITK